MDAMVRTLTDWIEIPSVTGDEKDYAEALATRLTELGFDVLRQEVSPGRFNVLARAGVPTVVLCTHLDTVPPWFGSRTTRDAIHGRGSCDAKGPAVAMLAAGTRLLASGEDRFGFLFTVGEEVDSAGAAFADAHLAELGPVGWAPRYVIVGEPTEGKFVRAGKGIFKATLSARGVAGHSSQDVGPSAVHELVGCVHRILSADWGQHPVLGPGTVNFGRIEGGVAANVVADRARASILVRAVEEPETVRARIRAALGDHVELDEDAKAYAPIEFLVPDEGGEGLAVAYGTDAPHMRSWGTPLLVGPGSILDAHTDHEKVGVRELDEAAACYERTVRWLLARFDAE